MPGVARLDLKEGIRLNVYGPWLVCFTHWWRLSVYHRPVQVPPPQRNLLPRQRFRQEVLVEQMARMKLESLNRRLRSRQPQRVESRIPWSQRPPVRKLTDSQGMIKQVENSRNKAHKFDAQFMPRTGRKTSHMFLAPSAATQAAAAGWIWPLMRQLHSTNVQVSVTAVVVC